MKVIHEPSLSRLTTLRLGGIAIAQIIIEAREDLLELEKTLKKLGGRPFWLGKGSNLLAKDGFLPLCLVRQRFHRRPAIIQENDAEVTVQADAGYPLQAFLAFCAHNGLSGMEGLTGIPGTVGGAVKMNAGSFGTSAAEHLQKVEVFLEGDMISYDISQLQPHYRNLAFPFPPGKGVILNSTFTLTRCQKNAILEKMFHNFFEKKSKQPMDLPSAGCVFKNPPDAPAAGALLEKAGFKGKKLGGMAFSEKHANFLINTGNGTAKEALELVSLAMEKVKAAFGITLEKEVEIIP